LFCWFSSLSTFAEQQWIEVRSPHFSVATDGGEKRAATGAAHIQARNDSLAVSSRSDQSIEARDLYGIPTLS